VENNVDKCKMIINEKEYKLCSFLNENDEIKEDIFEIKLKGINNIINAFGLFNGCLSLVSLPNISKWDTSNVTNM
jgi:surface protein